MSKAISRRDFMKVTGAVGAAGLLAACGGNSAASSSAASTASSAPAASADESLALSDGPVSMTISWWGGDSRHEAYQNAIKEFQAEHTNITIEPTFAAWSCAQKKTISCGRMEMRDRARILFHAKPVSPSMDSLTNRDIGYLPGVLT